MGLALAFDLDRCIGCKACEAACKLEHGLGPGQFRNRVLWAQASDGKALEFLFAPGVQCERPACVRACGVYPKALSRTPEGVIVVDPKLCVGCMACVEACPYGVMGFDPRTQKADKCDLCGDRRAQEMTTACVAVCPGRALGLVETSGPVADPEGRVRRDLDLFGQRPTMHYLEHDGPHRREGNAVLREYHPRAADGVARSLLGGLRQGLRPEGEQDGAPALPYVAGKSRLRPDRIAKGGCNICFNSCSAKFRLLGNQVLRITGNDEDPVSQGRICSKVQTSLQVYANPRRLQYPMRRVGARGEGRFERIGWEQALDELAERLRRVRDAHGPEALGLYTVTRAGYFGLRGSGRIFAEMFGTPNHSGTQPLCGEAGDVALQMTFGVASTANAFTEADIGSSDFYLFVGDNMAESRPVYFGMLNDGRLRQKVPMLAVDPRLTPTASKADEWLPIRPGTHMALALGMLGHIFAHGLEDTGFLRQWVGGARRSGTSSGSAGTRRPRRRPSRTCRPRPSPAWRNATRARRPMLFANRGLMQHSNAVQTVRAFLMLAAACGHLGQRGAGVMLSNGQSRLGARTPAGRSAVRKPGVRRNPVGWLDPIRIGKPYPIRALILTGNPLSLWPGQAEVREAFRQLEVVAHLELFANDTSAWADYVFPAATGIEAGECNRGNDDRRIVWIDKLIKPPGEARPDLHFWIDLGKRFGFDDVLRPDLKDPVKFWDEMMLADPLVQGMTVASLRASPTRWRRSPLPAAGELDRDTLGLEGESYPGASGKRWPTPSGKVELVTPELEAQFRAYGLSALPEFYSDPEQLVDLPSLEYTCSDGEPGVPSPYYQGRFLMRPVRIVHKTNPLKATYDTELITGRPPAPHFHSWTHWSWQPHEMWPDPFVQMHPDKAAALGVVDGDRVVVESPRGAIEGVAWVYPGIRKTSVYVPVGWGEREPFNPWQTINWLLPRDQRCPISEQANLKATLCRVRKA